MRISYHACKASPSTNFLGEWNDLKLQRDLDSECMHT